jgi:P-type Ca2+ transporter type 2C
VAVATGIQTEMGHIAGMGEAAPQDTILLQKELPGAGELLAVIVVAIAVIMLATIIFVGEVRGFRTFFDASILRSNGCCSHSGRLALIRRVDAS